MALMFAEPAVIYASHPSPWNFHEIIPSQQIPQTTIA
jgi:hypothetical protein